MLKALQTWTISKDITLDEAVSTWPVGLSKKDPLYITIQWHS